jgi:hypothetical protein
LDFTSPSQHPIQPAVRLGPSQARERPAGLPEVSSPSALASPRNPPFPVRRYQLRPSTPACGFSPPRRLPAPRASRSVSTRSALGVRALQSFLPSGERLPGLPGPLPSCRLASETEPRAACATHGCFGAPTAGLSSHRRVRTSRHGGLDRRGPAALLSLHLLQGFLPGCVARPFDPASLSRFGPAGPRGFLRAVRLRASTRNRIGWRLPTLPALLWLCRLFDPCGCP